MLRIRSWIPWKIFNCLEPECEKTGKQTCGPGSGALSYALDKLAIFSEKTRLADFVLLMQNPWRLMWLNFMVGLARGVGMVIGGSIFGVLFLVVTVQSLRYAFHHVGALPWIGNDLEDALQWLLAVIDKHKAGK